MHNDYTSVIRNIDKLNREIWYFWFYDHTLWLDQYVFEHRETSRHRWVYQKYYSRLNNRYNGSGHIITPQDVPLYESVRAEAILNFISGIEVKLWQS